jgi:hypothetical protein
MEWIKDGECHVHCQASCDYKQYGKCRYVGEDSCSGQYVKAPLNVESRRVIEDNAVSRYFSTDRPD